MDLIVGGKMGNKINLNLCANYNNREFKKAIVNGLLCYYAIEKLRLTIKGFQKDELDMFYVYEEYKEVIDESNNVTFAHIREWGDHKRNSYLRLLEIVDKLDNLASDAGLIERGSLYKSFNDDCVNYGLQLTLCSIDRTCIDLNQVEIKEEYLSSCLAEVMTVDEGQFLSDISTMQIEMTPLDTRAHRNSFIEKKLNKLNSLASMAESTLDRGFTSLNKDLMSSYSRLYRIIHGLLSDSEKVDESRKVYRLVAPYRKTLDKLENKLVEANELKRQLTLHKKKLKDALDSREISAGEGEDNQFKAESLGIDYDAQVFVTEDYYNKIDYTIARVNNAMEEITKRYNVLDKVEIALKGAVPSESEMKRYSALSFKFQDLYTRLELAKSQVNKDDEAFKEAIKTAIYGLGVLLNLTIEGKDIFMRNTLMSGIFNSVNFMYDIVDDKNKSVELSQIKFVTSRLADYTDLNMSFSKDLQTYRHVCNNVIRDIAILMGKPFNFNGMMEIIETIDLAIKQIESLKEDLDKNHKKQSQMLSDILNV